MAIDVHAHYWTNDYLDVLLDLGKADANAARGNGSSDGEELVARLQLMERAGVDVQVLSAAPQMPYAEDRQKAVAAARFVNDQYAALVERYPDRFRAFAATPMPHIEEAIVGIGRALDELDMVGVVMNTAPCSTCTRPETRPVPPLIRDFNMTWMVGAPIEARSPRCS